MLLLLRFLSVVAVATEGLLPPLAEPSAEEYFGLLSGGKIQPVDRFRDISVEDFNARVRTGRPFIVEDAGRENSLVGTSCERFHERFPGAKMRAEYAGGERAKFISLGSKGWLHKDRRTQTAREHMSGGDRKLNGPYVWHVKDGGHEAPPEIKAIVQKEWKPPYFVRGATNLREATESIEFWFSRRGGAVLAHADTYCIPAVSLQLRGTKKWRLMPPPPVLSADDRYDAHDGGIYGTGLWKPGYEATIHEGEAIIFFPNMYHETYLPEDGPECTVAATFQFQLPLPVRYFRAFLPTHVMSHLYSEGHCRELWHSYATLRAPGDVKPTCRKEKMESHLSELFAAADTNADKELTVEEVEAHLAAQSPPWPRWFLTDDYFYDFRPELSDREVMSIELLRNRAEDTLAYHDIDGNGRASEAEVLASLQQWAVVNQRLAMLERLEKRGASPKDVRRSEEKFVNQCAKGHVGRLTHSRSEL